MKLFLVLFVFNNTYYEIISFKTNIETLNYVLEIVILVFAISKPGTRISSY